MALRRAGMAGIMALLALQPAGYFLADLESLTLYQKTARAPLVIKARPLSDSTRRPRVEVVEIFKGSYPARTLVIVPHFEDNASPTPWLKREVFREGEESILFLTQYVDEFGRDEGPGTFTVLNADKGKIAIPPEGSGALIEALRRFVTILSLGQHDRQGEALRGLLREGNPHLLEAGLTECRKFRLAEPEDVDILVGLLKNRRPDFRAGALALLEQIMIESKEGEEPAAGPGSLGPALFQHVAAAARLDGEESVRRQAVAVLGAFGDEPALVLIESIGKADADQGVRYEAQVAAHRLREKLRGHPLTR